MIGGPALRIPLVSWSAAGPNKTDFKIACVADHDTVADCLAVTVGQCAAMLYTYQGTNYSSILFSQSTDNASTTASLFLDDYCGKTVKSASFPNALTPNPGIFTSYYQWNDDDYVKQTWKAMCASIP